MMEIKKIGSVIARTKGCLRAGRVAGLAKKKIHDKKSHQDRRQRDSSTSHAFWDSVVYSSASHVIFGYRCDFRTLTSC